MIRPGYSRATFNANIAEMMRAGHSRESSIWTAAALARKSYFRANPGGALPVWLAWPKSFRLRKFYDEHGEPVTKHPDLQDNPVSLARAKRLYKGFTGAAARTVRKINLPPPPQTVLAIGKVFGIMYQVAETGERFRHEFQGKARPSLLVSDDGRQVILRGGAYTFTNRGFVDNP